MQHVVNIAFDFDDERVKKILEDTTVDKIQKEIKQAVIDEIFEKQWSNKHAVPDRDPLQAWATRFIKELIAEHKDEIIKQAAKDISERLFKSPKFREQIAKEVAE